AYIGFDAVSTAAQEARNPQKDMPIGILGSLLVCTLLYVLVSALLTGMVNYKELLALQTSSPPDYAAPMAYAMKHVGAPEWVRIRFVIYLRYGRYHSRWQREIASGSRGGGSAGMRQAPPAR